MSASSTSRMSRTLFVMMGSVSFPGDLTAIPSAIVETPKVTRRAARFERCGELEVLELQEDVRARDARQVRECRQGVSMTWPAMASMSDNSQAHGLLGHG